MPSWTSMTKKKGWRIKILMANPGGFHASLPRRRSRFGVQWATLEVWRRWMWSHEWTQCGVLHSWEVMRCFKLSDYCLYIYIYIFIIYMYIYIYTLYTYIYIYIYIFFFPFYFLRYRYPLTLKKGKCSLHFLPPWIGGMILDVFSQDVFEKNVATQNSVFGWLKVMKKLHGAANSKLWGSCRAWNARGNLPAPLLDVAGWHSLWACKFWVESRKP